MNPRSLITKSAKAWPLWCSMAKTASAFAPSAPNVNIHSIGQQGSSFQPQPTTALRLNEYYNSRVERWMSTSLGSFLDEGTENEYGSSTSVNFAMSPDSDEARSVTESLGISPEKHDLLARHAQLVVEWNERLNLISRKDCNVDVVFGRHILPSVALAGLPDFPTKDADEDGGNADTDGSKSRSKVVDVGTGGGFPGVPLAIIYPDVDFLLVDSVGKKLKAVDEMVAELGLENVQTFHGRAEEIVDDPIKGRKHKNAYDICVGRSVSALPRFCFWIQDLLKKKNKAKGKANEGRLVYIIGGTVESSVTTRVAADTPIDDLLECDGASDKRVLVVSSSDVVSIARESGEKKQKRGQTRNKNKNNSKRSSAKGKWQEKDNSAQKQRGYENFKRYGSN